MTATLPNLGRALASAVTLTVTATVIAVPTASADNSRLNNGVFANIYTAQKQNGCTEEPRLDGRLVQAARNHTWDLINDHGLDGDLGSDGSTPQDRAQTLGFVGTVQETVAINQSFAINGIDILGQWYRDPALWGIVRDCSHTAVGVWSENSFDRSVVVAVYGVPA